MLDVVTEGRSLVGIEEAQQVAQGALVCDRMALGVDRGAVPFPIASSDPSMRIAT